MSKRLFTQPADLLSRNSTYDLAEITPAKLLWELTKLSATGTVEFTVGEDRWRLALEARRIRSAQSSDPDSQLGQILIKDETLTSEELVRATQEAKRTGQRLGITLVELGLASPLSIRDGLALQVSRVLEMVLPARRGRAEFEPRVFNTSPLFEIPVRRALFESLMHQADIATLGPLGGQDARLKCCFEPTDLLDIALDEDDIKLISRANGRRNLEELSHEGLFSPERNGRLLVALFELGLMSGSPRPTVRLKRHSAAESHRDRFTARSSNESVQGSAAAEPSIAAPAEVRVEALKSAPLQRGYEAALELLELAGMEKPDLVERPASTAEETHARIRKS